MPFNERITDLVKKHGQRQEEVTIHNDGKVVLKLALRKKQVDLVTKVADSYDEPANTDFLKEVAEVPDDRAKVGDAIWRGVKAAKPTKVEECIERRATTFENSCYWQRINRIQVRVFPPGAVTPEVWTKAMDSRARRVAKKVGYRAVKCRYHDDALCNQGGYNLYRERDGKCVGDDSFTMSAAEVIEICKYSPAELNEETKPEEPQIPPDETPDDENNLPW